MIGVLSVAPCYFRKTQVRLDGQSRYPTLWPSFVELGQSQSAQFPCIIFRIRKGEDKGRKRKRRSFTSIQMLHTHRPFFPSSENLDRTQSHIFTRYRLHFSKLTYPWKMTHLQMTYPWNMLISIAFCILTLKPWSPSFTCQVYSAGFFITVSPESIELASKAPIWWVLNGTHPIQIGHGTRKTDFWYSRDSMFSWQKWRNWGNLFGTSGCTPWRVWSKLLWWRNGHDIHLALPCISSCGSATV